MNVVERAEKHLGSAIRYRTYDTGFIQIGRKANKEQQRTDGWIIAKKNRQEWREREQVRRLKQRSASSRKIQSSMSAHLRSKVTRAV